MGELAIRVSGLGKQYRLGAQQERYATFRDQVRTWASASLRTLVRRAKRRERRPTFWALKDVSFEVNRGEVVGIIGRNGAGKSTLLKVLSRITEPTEGEADIHGRVGSLLEVGTGFHPELTGRENVYLNGAILGMRRSEIGRKFDEIVSFAEVEKFIDTPVKHYSSGMYTRLAFAVAAHLEPEILIVDEVLAVGDAQFQKKCLGKMGDVARGGRTVLFVSHNMQAVGQLTTSVVMLEQGRVVFQGPTPEGVAKYTAGVFGERAMGQPYAASPGREGVHVAAARVRTSDAYGEHVCCKPIRLEFDVRVAEPREGLCLSVQVCDEAGRPVCHFWMLDRGREFLQGAGVYRAVCEVPQLRMYQGRYTLTTWLADRRGGDLLEKLSEICPFEVSMRGHHKPEYGWAIGEMVYREEFEWAPVVRVEETPGG
ncbi:MAG TPA: polysaccharide ABC transporter ATP-binding protein [Fimbriiglobus sp.]|nr:polysaccharide ABC transporter ATP-binding protein [Fimbriiglobus sp.]